MIALLGTDTSRTGSENLDIRDVGNQQSAFRELRFTGHFHQSRGILVEVTGTLPSEVRAEEVQ
jgi:hypothetical protein